jgi:hypothetical protein
MRNLVINDMAADLGDFKPTHVADGFSSSIDRIVHGVFDAVGRRTDQLDLFVDVITHNHIKHFWLGSSEQIPESSLCCGSDLRALSFSRCTAFEERFFLVCRKIPAIRIGKIRRDG